MIRLRLLFLLSIVLAGTMLVGAQENRSWEYYLEQLTDDDDHETTSYERLHEALSELEAKPINLNTATPDELQQLIFLSDQQQEDLYEYIDRYRPLRSMGELLMIPSIGRLYFSLLKCFVYIGEEEQQKDTITLKSLLHGGRHELTAALKVPMYEHKGDRNGYLGYKYKHWFRYDFNSKNRLRFGFVGSQDAGEPFFSSPANMGYDYYSFYLQLQGYKRLRNMVIGRYRLSMGKGLVVNTDLSFGKTATLASLGRTSDNIRPHSSRSEANYFQGAAATLSLGADLTATAFASYRALDATLNDDGTIATILSSGYHRTPSEVRRRHNAHATVVGGALAYDHADLHIGATAVYTSLNRPLQPDIKQVFRRHYAAGNGFLNAGVNYSWRNRLFLLGGETAISGNGAIATLNNLNVRLSSDVSMLLLQRFYSYRYTSLYANSMSDGGTVQNESGVYLGADWRPSRSWRISAYTDFAYFAWPKYQASQSSRSFDNMLSVIYTSNNWTLSARYRWRMRQRDNENKSALVYHHSHTSRFSMAYKAKGFSSTTRLSLSAYSAGRNSFGYMLGQSAGYTGKRLSAVASVFYFNTDDYDSRIYVSERGMLYTMSSLMCYGHGLRYSLLARISLTDRLMLLAKAATTNYFDRSTVGSGLQQIDSSSLTDIDVQLKWRF